MSNFSNLYIDWTPRQVVNPSDMLAVNASIALQSQALKLSNNEAIILSGGNRVLYPSGTGEISTGVFLVRDQVIDGVLIPGGPFKCERTNYTPTDGSCFLIARIVIQKTGINYTITGRYLDITNDPNSYNPNTDVIIYKRLSGSRDITRSMDLGYSVSSNQASRQTFIRRDTPDIGLNSLCISAGIPPYAPMIRLPSTLEILNSVASSNNVGSPSSGGYLTTVYTPSDCQFVIDENDVSVFVLNGAKSLKIPAKSTINFLLLCDYNDQYKWYII
jgi:hypothetical protein